MQCKDCIKQVNVDEGVQNFDVNHNESTDTDDQLSVHVEDSFLNYEINVSNSTDMDDSDQVGIRIYEVNLEEDSVEVQLRLQMSLRTSLLTNMVMGKWIPRDDIYLGITHVT